MSDLERLKYLKVALRIVAIIMIFGFYPLTVFWPSGWSWSSGRSEYLEMIIAIYATLGIFLLVASRNPNQHLSLISFAIWSSIVHGAVMAVQVHAQSDACASFVWRRAGTNYRCRCARVSLASCISPAFHATRRLVCLGMSDLRVRYERRKLWFLRGGRCRLKAWTLWVRSAPRLLCQYRGVSQTQESASQGRFCKGARSGEPEVSVMRGPP